MPKILNENSPALFCFKPLKWVAPLQAPSKRFFQTRLKTSFIEFACTLVWKFLNQSFWKVSTYFLYNIVLYINPNKNRNIISIKQRQKRQDFLFWPLEKQKFSIFYTIWVCIEERHITKLLWFRLFWLKHKQKIFSKFTKIMLYYKKCMKIIEKTLS